MYRHLLVQTPKSSRRRAFLRNGALAINLAHASLQIALGLLFLGRPTAFAETTNFGLLAETATQQDWGLICLAIGFCSLIGASAFDRTVKSATSLISGSLLGVLAYSCFRSHPVGAAWLPYTVLAGLSYWLVLARLFAE